MVTWVFNMGILFANEWFGGYRFGSLGEGFGFLVRFVFLID